MFSKHVYMIVEISVNFLSLCLSFFKIEFVSLDNSYLRYKIFN